ncbi:polysaccharide biosynthesis protein, partial [bacterium]|nr:polysaccharide biosynthesis protein [candidate division CSSED10-310 bacterium]
IARKFFKMSNISLSWFQTKKLIKKTWIIGVATFCTALSFRVDIFILKILAPQGSRTIALFHVPHMVVLQLQVIAVALVTALFPTFSRFAASNQSDKAYLEIRDYAFRFLSVSGIWIAMFLIIFAKPLILLLGGSSYLESVSPMKILAWCIPILFLNYLSTNLLTSFKRQNVLIVGAAVSLVINVILDITLIPSLGAEGAAWGTLIAYTSQLMIAFGFLMSIGDRSWGLWNSIGIPVLMGLAALFLWSFAFDAFENLLPLFGSGFLLALLVGFYVIQPKQLKNLLKAFFRTRRSPHV